jgi:ProP effector
MSTKRARTKAVITVLAAKFPKCFAVSDTRRRPLKVGIDADLLAALGGSIRRTELIRALAMYCSSDGYLERMLTGAWRVDLEGKSAGAVSPEDEKHAKAKQAGIRTRREAVMAAAIAQTATSRIQGPALAAKAEPGPGPKRLSLADLREAARRRREGRPEGLPNSTG